MRRLRQTLCASLCIALAACDSHSKPVQTAAAVFGNAQRCTHYNGLPDNWPRDKNSGMVKIGAGDFIFGSDDGYPDEKPQARRHVDTFWIDQTEVTNAQFATFVAATGYVTDAERTGNSALFRMPTATQIKNGGYSWWVLRADTNWKNPAGDGSKSSANQPVVHVTQRDALAYARWLGHDLPTEAEWEYAAKAGRNDAKLDTEPADAGGHPTANYWQGTFPEIDTGDDGFKGLAPVGCFDANAFQLYDMIGNAWEWTRDNEFSRTVDASQNTLSNNTTNARAVIKGGSFLCSRDFCARYRAAAREAQENDLSSSHVGFRTIFRKQQ